MHADLLITHMLDDLKKAILQSKGKKTFFYLRTI